MPVKPMKPQKKASTKTAPRGGMSEMQMGQAALNNTYANMSPKELREEATRGQPKAKPKARK